MSGLNREKFDSGWRRNAEVRACPVSHVFNFIKAHYIGKRPAVTVLALSMDVAGVPVGMVVFALPPRETSRRYGGLTWELARLYIADHVPRNAETYLLSRAIRHVKQKHPEVKVLVSYADPSAGHRGHIYIAGNWQPDGKTDDERKSPRCDYMDAANRKYSRRSHVPDGVEVRRVPRVSKFRFIYRLRK